MPNDSWVEFLLSNLRCQHYWHLTNQPRPILQATERTSFTLGKAGWQDRNPSALVSSNQGLNTTENKNLGFSWKNLPSKTCVNCQGKDHVRELTWLSEIQEAGFRKCRIIGYMGPVKWEKWRMWSTDLSQSYITTSKSNREVSFHHLIDLIKGILKHKIGNSYRNNLLCVN